jgi:hypothetical protein
MYALFEGNPAIKLADQPGSVGRACLVVMVNSSDYTIFRLASENPA